MPEQTSPENMLQPLPVKGYSPQSKENTARVNFNKELEEDVLKRIDELKLDPNIDQRWLAICKTHIEEGFMAMNRAIFKPTRLSEAQR